MAGIFSSGFNDQFTAPIYMSSPLPAVPGMAAAATSVVPLPQAWLCLLPGWQWRASCADAGEHARPRNLHSSLVIKPSTGVRYV